MKKPNIIDEKETFRINENCKINIISIGDLPAVIIDDVYVNPELVRDLCLTSPATSQNKMKAGLEGQRVHAKLDLSSISKLWWELTTSTFHHARNWSYESILKAFETGDFNANIILTKPQFNLNRGTLGTPHVDGPVELIEDIDGIEWMPPKMGGLVGLVYLNYDEECSGGTSFYKFDGKQTVDQNNPPCSTNKTDRVPDRKWISDSVGDWELIEVVEMKWNRMIIYPNFILHSSYITEEMKFDGNPTYRINQPIFP